MYIDAETYKSGKGSDGFEWILMDHIHRIMKLSCNEWHGGFYQGKPLPTGNGQYTLIEGHYIQATHEAYSNAVDSLTDLLYPHFDEEMREQADEHIQEENEQLEEELSSVGDDIKAWKQRKQVFYLRRVFRSREWFRELMKWIQSSGLFQTGGYEEVLK